MFRRRPDFEAGLLSFLACRYSYGDAHLAELVAHVALEESQGAGVSTAVSTPDSAKRRRLGNPGGLSLASPENRRSPLEAVENHWRKNPEWAALHARQAWFLQVRGPG